MDWIWKVITAILVPLMFLIGTSVIANDQCSRSRDTDLERQVNSIIVKQMECNEEIKLSLLSIQKDVEYMSKRGIDAPYNRPSPK